MSEHLMTNHTAGQTSDPTPNTFRRKLLQGVVAHADDARTSEMENKEFNTSL